LSSTSSGLVATLSGVGSSDPDGAVVSYAWSFGDGQSGSGSSPTIDHPYGSSGTYPVTLTVTDDQGATGQASGQVTVTGPGVVNFVSDTFSRTVGSGWGSAELGGPWTVDSANFSVASGVGRMSSTPGAVRTASVNVTQASTEVNAKLSFDKTLTGGGVYVATIGRRINATNDYRLKLRAQPGGAVTAQLIRTVAGAETAIQTVATVPGLTWVQGDVLRVRLQVTGTSPTTLRAKVWKDPASEPATWLLQANDSTAALQAPGGVGLWTYLSSSATTSPLIISVDDLTAGPAG